MEKIKCNLHKAQKYLTKLNQEIKGISISGVAVLNIDLSDNSEFILKEMDKKIKTENEEFEKFMILNEDLNKIKKEVFKENLKNGTHELLTELNLKRKIVSINKGILSNIKRNSDVRKDITKEFVESKQQVLKDTGTSYATRVNYALFNEEVLEAKIKELSKDIEKLEDKLATNNITTEIEVLVNEKTIELLNLD